MAIDMKQSDAVQGPGTRNTAEQDAAVFVDDDREFAIGEARLDEMRQVKAVAADRMTIADARILLCIEPIRGTRQPFDICCLNSRLQTLRQRDDRRFQVPGSLPPSSGRRPRSLGTQMIILLPIISEWLLAGTPQ